MGKAVEIVKRLVELYNDGTTEEYGSDNFLELFAPDADWAEMPSFMFPSGRTIDDETIRESLMHCNKMLRNRRLELNEVIEKGNVVAWRAVWSAAVAVDRPDGLPIKAGSRIQVHMAVFTEVIDDLIVRQHEYLSNPEIGMSGGIALDSTLSIIKG